MRRLLLLSLLVAAPAWAVPNEWAIQPDETYVWGCTMPAPMQDVVLATVTRVAGPADATPATLVTNPVVDGTDPTHVLWWWTPVGHPNGAVYAIHILAEDSSGQRFACDGKLTVKAAKVVL